MKHKRKTDEPIRTADPKAKPYDGAELRPFEGRIGAMDAYKLPSRRGNQLVEPSLYMRNTEGETK